MFSSELAKLMCSLAMHYVESLNYEEGSRHGELVKSKIHFVAYYSLRSKLQGIFTF